MDIGERIARAGLDLTGTPFRLRGRARETGVDCVGLVLLALDGAGISPPVPPGYFLRGTSPDGAEASLCNAGLERVGKARVGDIVLVRSGPMQLHLMIRASGGHVHAHASLGRVVFMPGASPWPVLSCWRLPSSSFSE